MSTPLAPRHRGPSLRDPAHSVSPRAVSYWRVVAALNALVLWVALGIGYWFIPGRPWWASAGLVTVVVASIAYVVAMPTVRFRIHRWEVTPVAVFTRSGWITREERVAPLSRVQTVDSKQGALMRLFKLRSITVTTASAAGPITVFGLDDEVARLTVAELTAITGATEGDAT
ncbi:PH domain-containing protein [Nocardioides pacificus]